MSEVAHDFHGRLVAAEKNSRAAIELASRLSAEKASLETRLHSLEEQLIQAEQRFFALQALVVSKIGTGPTGR